MRVGQSNIRFTVVALAVALLFILNPEVRAYLIFADALGIDLLIFLMAMQIRLLLGSMHAFSGPMRGTFCNAVYPLVALVIRVTTASFAFRPLAILACPMLLIVPATSECHLRTFEPRRR
jgi:hypothetical protein